MIALYLISAHMAGDYLFQTHWMAAGKLGSWWPRFIHVLVYTACFIPVALAEGSGARAAAFLGALYVLHFLTDSHRWRTANPWPPMPILHDQSLHAVQLALLGGLFYG